MKSFRDYFKKFINESPDQGGDNELFSNKTDEELGLNNIPGSGEYEKILNISEYNVSLWEYVDGFDVVIQFVDNDTKENAGSVTYEIFDDGGIKITSVMNKPKYKGLAFWIYRNFLLERYQYIMSDGKHSKMGEAFWKKLIDFNQDKNVSVWKYFDPENKEYIKDIQNSSEMDEFYGSSGYHNYVFVISNK